VKLDFWSEGAIKSNQQRAASPILSVLLMSDLRKKERTESRGDLKY